MTTTRTVRLTVPAAYHDKAKFALRKLREVHKKTGGFTKLRQDGDVFTLVIKGDPKVVDTTANYAAKIESFSSLNERLDKFSTMMGGRGARQKENLNAVVNHARDILNRTGK